MRPNGSRRSKSAGTSSPAQIRTPSWPPALSIVVAVRRTRRCTETGMPRRLSCRCSDDRTRTDSPVARRLRAVVVGRRSAPERTPELPLRVPGGSDTGSRRESVAALLRLQRSSVLRRHGAGCEWNSDPALPPISHLQSRVYRVVWLDEPGAFAPPGRVAPGDCLAAGGLAPEPRGRSRRWQCRVAVHRRLG